MSEMNDIVVATISRVFDEQVDHELILKSAGGVWPEALWQTLVELGLPLALVDENSGGIGLAPSAVFDLIRLAGAATLPLPLGETIIAQWLSSRLGLPVSDGPLAFVADVLTPGFEFQRNGAASRLAGSARRVPWARNAEQILLLARDADGLSWLLVPRDRFTFSQGRNLAGEPRDDLAIDTNFDGPLARGNLSVGPAELLALGAALRCAAMAGAIEQALVLTTAYANERVQFGKPIGRQQAIQHALAQLAGEAAAARAAASMAAAAVDSERIAILPIAAAKARIGEAAGKVAAIAHQVHGAIGFTREHRLHDLTTRLWSWRDEYGNERHWNTVLGKAALAAGAEGYWPLVTELAEATERMATS